LCSASKRKYYYTEIRKNVKTNFIAFAKIKVRIFFVRERRKYAGNIPRRFQPFFGWDAEAAGKPRPRIF